MLLRDLAFCCIVTCFTTWKFAFFFLFFFKDTATTEIYTRRSSAASDVYKRQVHHDTDGQHEREQRDQVDRQIEQLHHEEGADQGPVSYTHLRAHETVLDLVCRLLLENKNIKEQLHTY